MDNSTKGLIGLALIAYLLWKNSKKPETEEVIIVDDIPYDTPIEYGQSVEGCTDSLALNYDARASVDNGSCMYVPVLDGPPDYIPPSEGCTIPEAINYDPGAFVDDGSCDFSNVVYGCPFQGAVNFDPEATIDDGSCDFGLADDIVDPPDPQPNTTCYGDCPNTEGVSVIGLICPDTHPNIEQPLCDINESFGCTDPSATNYDPDATQGCEITGGTTGFNDEQIQSTITL